MWDFRAKEKALFISYPDVDEVLCLATAGPIVATGGWVSGLKVLYPK